MRKKRFMTILWKMRKTDSIAEAYEEFDGDYSEEELRVMRIKFMSEVAN